MPSSPWSEAGETWAWARPRSSSWSAHTAGESAHEVVGLAREPGFVVNLPLDPAKDPSPTTRTPVLKPSSRRVLIIEDNQDAAESLKEVLEFGEHEVAVAYNGPEGLAKAHEFQPDVVLCDIGLPGMDGCEVARRLRTDRALDRTCLVALSGYSLPEEVKRAADAGFQHHLAKPATVQQIERLLAGMPPTRSADA